MRAVASECRCGSGDGRRALTRSTEATLIDAGYSPASDEIATLTAPLASVTMRSALSS